MRLRLPRFSMRFLLGAMLVIGVGLGIVGREAVRISRRAKKQRSVISALEAKGAHVATRSKAPQSLCESVVVWFDPSAAFQEVDVMLNVAFSPLRRSAEIDQLTRLDGLNMYFDAYANCSDDQVRALANNPTLKAVYLINGDCSLSSLKALAGGAAPLEKLHLSGIAIDDEFLEIASRRSELVSLGFSGDQVTTKGLASLRNAARLHTLQITGGGNLGGAFAKLADHPQLRNLELIDYHFSQTDLESLGNLGLLRQLEIRAGRFPKGILGAVSRMRSLESIKIEGEFAQDEPTGAMLFTSIRNFSLDKHGQTCPPGLLSQLARSKSLDSIAAPSAAITVEDLQALAGLPQMGTITIGSSPSREAIKQLQRACPYCVYIDGQWGVFQPSVGINIAKMQQSGNRTGDANKGLAK